MTKYRFGSTKTVTQNLVRKSTRWISLTNQRTSQISQFKEITDRIMLYCLGLVCG